MYVSDHDDDDGDDDYPNPNIRRISYPLVPKIIK